MLDKKKEKERGKKYRNSKKYKDTIKRYRKTNKFKIASKRSRLRRRYGIMIEEYNELFNEQNGCCAICGKHQSKVKGGLGVDHCHTTKIVRGLLCRNCNFALGLLHDDIEIIDSVLDYLKKYKLK